MQLYRLVKKPGTILAVLLENSFFTWSNLSLNSDFLYRMPVQYIIGEWDFHNITLKMRPPVFIPRPETESLVEKALEHMQGISAPKVLEIGCGSGAISLSLLKCMNEVSEIVLMCNVFQCIQSTISHGM